MNRIGMGVAFCALSTVVACGSSSDAPVTRVEHAAAHPRGPQPDADG